MRFENCAAFGIAQLWKYTTPRTTTTEGDGGGGGYDRGGSRELCRISASQERRQSAGFIRPIGAEKSKLVATRSGRDADVVVFPAHPHALMRFHINDDPRKQTIHVLITAGFWNYLSCAQENTRKTPCFDSEKTKIKTIAAGDKMCQADWKRYPLNSKRFESTDTK